MRSVSVGESILINDGVFTVAVEDGRYILKGDSLLRVAMDNVKQRGYEKGSLSAEVRKELDRLKGEVQA